MRACFLFLLLGNVFYGRLQAQVAGADPVLSGSSHLVSLSAHVPIGVFSQSHVAGAGLSYSWSAHRYGSSKIIPSKPAGLTFTGGAAYYFGKKVTTAGHDFRYSSYTYLHAGAGVIVNPWEDGSISVTAGPGVGIYGGKTSVGAAAGLCGNYFIRPRMAIGPEITYKKHARTDALWTGGIRVSCVF
ncbi:MAG: hypothetical protein ABW019_06155 [Chitinophagaceae bacterium]